MTQVLRQLVAAARKSHPDTEVSVLLGNGSSIQLGCELLTPSALVERVCAGASRDEFDVDVASRNTSTIEAYVGNMSPMQSTNDSYIATGGTSPSRRSTALGVLLDVFPDRQTSLDELEYTSFVETLKNVESGINGQAFTLNYDCCLYWGRMDSSRRSFFADGFGKCLETASGDWLQYQPTAPRRVHYLHGAMFLFENSRGTPFKLRRTDSTRNLKEIASGALTSGNEPLIVLEGGSKDKLKLIRASQYLNDQLLDLERLSGVLVVYGWAMNPDFDQHILDAIGKSNIATLIAYCHTECDEENTRKQIGLLNEGRTSRSITEIRLEVVPQSALADARREDGASAPADRRY